MERKCVCVNIYNFIRMSHVEPSRFILDDFETIRNQIITLKQYGFPGTYALKYDALMESRYQALLKEFLDDGDEISAWWEITRELCERSGVEFRDSSLVDKYDDRVDSAYSIGYSPEERKHLVDGYMADFYSVFGKYPQSIGSWVLDSVTMEYASEKYGIVACAICRDQIGVDGFTLWGGYPNGAYYPSRKNENIPAQSVEDQLSIPVFRLLGPDPIYNYEAEVRDGLQGVYTLEPSWLTGRDPKWISWFFDCLTEEDTIGMAYAHVGQENNFLWENIRPGFAPQLDVLKSKCQQGKLRVETMAQTAKRFHQKYRITPPMTFQASIDWWEENDLSCQWYACANYRIGFLEEKGHLRIRDLFLYNSEYPSRYLTGAMKGTRSNFDALPVLYPQLWKKGQEERPFIRLMDEKGEEPTGTVQYGSINAIAAEAVLHSGNAEIKVTMLPDGIHITGAARLAMDALPVFDRLEENTLWMTHEGFEYSFCIAQGTFLRAGKNGVEIAQADDQILLVFGKEQWSNEIFTPDYLLDSESIDGSEAATHVPKLEIPAFAPEFVPGDSVFSFGKPAPVEIKAREPGEIRYTLDGSDPDECSALYTYPLELREDHMICARLFTPDGRKSEVSRGSYCFCLKEMILKSPTVLDSRKVFCGNGMADLLDDRRGTLDYLDGTWRGSLQDMDITCVLAQPQEIASIAMGFLSHHRSGIVYPEKVELYVGSNENDLHLLEVKTLPCRPGNREIEKQDVVFAVHETIGAFRIIAHRYERMPQWCTYRGTTTVFTMADNLMVTPE